MMNYPGTGLRTYHVTLMVDLKKKCLRITSSMSVSKQIEDLTRRVTNLETLVQYRSSLSAEDAFNYVTTHADFPAGATAEEARQYLFANPPQQQVFSGGFFWEASTSPSHSYGSNFNIWNSYEVSDLSVPFNPFTMLEGTISLNNVQLINAINHPNLVWYYIDPNWTMTMSDYTNDPVQVDDPRDAELKLPNAANTYLIRFTASELYLSVPDPTDNNDLKKHTVRITTTAY